KGELTSLTEGSIGAPAGSASASPVQGNGRLAFALSLKSVNHRFLDLHFRLPAGSDSLEMQLRRLLKEKIARGHVEVTLSLDRLNQMREQEGRSIEQELRERMGHLREAVKTVQLHRRTVLQSYVERLQSRLQELLGSSVDKERVLQEAALLVDRSDIQEEIV